MPAISERAESEGRGACLCPSRSSRSLSSLLLPTMTIYTSPYEPIAPGEYHKGGVFDFVFAPERLDKRRDQVAIIDAVTGAKVLRIFTRLQSRCTLTEHPCAFTDDVRRTRLGIPPLCRRLHPYRRLEARRYGPPLCAQQRPLPRTPLCRTGSRTRRFDSQLVLSRRRTHARNPACRSQRRPCVGGSAQGRGEGGEGCRTRQ